MLKRLVVVAFALFCIAPSSFAVEQPDATPKPKPSTNVADYPNIKPEDTWHDWAQPSPTPVNQAPNSIRPWPKTQFRLHFQEGFKKIGLIPYYLIKDGLELFKKGHTGYTKDFSEKYAPVLSYESEDSKGKSETPSDELSIFAYDRNYELKGEIFDFNKLLKDPNAYADKDCSEVCPKGFEMLSLNLEQLKPTGENFLGFRNKADDFAHNVEETSGYCWGHSSVMDDFHYLGFFDKDNVFKAEIPAIESTGKDGTDGKAKWREYYKGLIDDIIKKGKGTIIPGFANVRSLIDSDDDLKEYVKYRVAMKWAKNGVKLRSIGNMFFDGKQMSIERTNRLLREVELRLLSNQTPKVIFAAEGDSTYSHVLNIYGIEKDKEGNYKLHVFETNYYPELFPDYTKEFHIGISRDGKATYDPLWHSRIGEDKLGENGKIIKKGHNRVGKIKFSFEEKESEVDFVRSLHRFCTKMTKCQK